MANTTTTEVAELIEKKVSTIVTDTLIQESVMIPSVRDFSALVGMGMDRLDIPLFNELAEVSVSESAAVTPATIDPSAAQLPLDQHKSIPWKISAKASVQSKLNLVAEAVRNGSRTMAAGVDNFILGLMDGSGATRTVLTANPLQDITLAKQQLDEANVPRSERYIVASPAFCKSLLDDNTIVNANQYGSREAQQNGEVTRLFGFTILESNSPEIQEDGFIAFHKQAFAFARQVSVSLKSEHIVLEHADAFSMSHLYGGVVTDASRIKIFDGDATP
jgi:hypothetical protein